LDFCYLKDQQPISAAAFQRARALCAQICALIAGRQETLRRMGRVADVHLPHGNWELGSGLYACYRTVVDGDYAIINNLRLFAQVFTGFQLVSLSKGQGLAIPREVPPHLDEHLAQLARQPPAEVDAYLEAITYLPDLLHITPPNVFGEVGWRADGKIINHDTRAYLERVILLAQCGKLWELRNRTMKQAALREQPWQRPRILEIGGGYGGLAYHLMNLIPEARYVIVDIPESLLFSSIYLSTLWEGKDNVLITPDCAQDLGKDTAGFTFLPNFLFDDCCAAGLEFDLVINTLSMSEMTEPQVRYYAEGIRRLLDRRGVFFEQNQDNRPLEMLDAKTILAHCFPLCLPLQSLLLPLMHGQPHLWAATAVKPYAWRPSPAVGRDDPWSGPEAGDGVGPKPKLIEEGYLGINVIYYRGRWYGLPQGGGPFDPGRVARREYAKLFTADSKEKLKQAIRSRGC